MLIGIAEQFCLIILTSLLVCHWYIFIIIFSVLIKNHVIQPHPIPHPSLSHIFDLARTKLNLVGSIPSPVGLDSLIINYISRSY